MPTNMSDQEKSAMASAASKGMGEGAKSSAKPASSATEAMGSSHTASESQASTLQKTAADKNEAAMKRLAAGVPSMKKGGLVPKTGLYKMHKNEIVLPSPDVLTGKAPKTAPGAKKTKVVNVKKGKKLSTGDKSKVHSAMKEVFSKVPKTVKATGKTGEAKRKMQVAIGLSKARAAGAKIPEKK